MKAKNFGTIGTLAACAVAVIGAAGYAMAGNTILFSSKTGDVAFPITAPQNDGAAGSIGDAQRGGMAPVNGVDSYLKAEPNSGFSYTFGNHQREMLFRAGTTLAAGYVTLAPAPTDGQQQCVWSKSAVTNFYLNPSPGQSINDAVTALTANTRTCYTYGKSNSTWDRSQ